MYEFILYRARTLVHPENLWTCLDIEVSGGSCSNKRTDKRKILVCVRRCALYETRTITTFTTQCNNTIVCVSEEWRASLVKQHVLATCHLPSLVPQHKQTRWFSPPHTVVHYCNIRTKSTTDNDKQRLGRGRGRRSIQGRVGHAHSGQRGVKKWTWYNHWHHDNHYVTRATL
jgi:hypothetical protein